MLYLVSYDLQPERQEYDRLIKGLQGAGGVRVLKSQWLLVSSSTAMALATDIANRLLDGNDRLLVTEVTKNTAWLRLLDQAKAQVMLDRNAR